MRKWLGVLVVLMVVVLLNSNAFAKMSVSAFLQTDWPVAKASGNLPKIDFDVLPDTERLINPVMTMGIIYNEDLGKAVPKLGIGALISYKKFFLQGTANMLIGAEYLPDVGHGVVAQVDLGYKVYKAFDIRIAHMSSIADSDDGGLNFIGVGFTFD